MYATVPIAVPGLVRCFSSISVGRFVFPVGGGLESGACFASPKSRSFAWPRFVTKMFAGLMSRWTMPRACAVSRASAIWAPRSSSVSSFERPGPEPVPQSLAVEQLHRDEGLALVLVDVVDRADVGVLERGGRACLTLQPLERLSVARQLFGQELERHAAAQFQILGLVDDAHAAAAQLRNHAVVGDRLADHRAARCATNSFCFPIASARIAANSGSLRIESKSGLVSMAGYERKLFSTDLRSSRSAGSR